MNGNSLVWVDLETTGLEETSDLILEVGVIITDYVGTIESKWASIITPTPMALDTRMERAGEFVQNMHRDNSLLEQIKTAQGMPQYKSEAVRDTMRDYLQHHFPDGGMPMCGSSVHFDRTFLHYDMPEIVELFSYRNIDISSIKEICNRLNPTLAAKRPEPRKLHRVIPDLEDTIDEYKFYVEYFFFTEASDG